jgi:hypothetical protein
MPTRLNLSLEKLRFKVSSELGHSFHQADHWGAPDEMTKVLKQVRHAFDSSAVETDIRSSTLALTRFKQTGRFANFIDLKYGCFGVGLPIKIGRQEWSVIGAFANAIKA